MNRYKTVNNTTNITNAIIALTNHEVIAYPTEAVFGLGCDPMSEIAVQRLLNIKQRPVEKGLILIAANFSQLSDYIDQSKLSAAQLDTIKQTWPGPTTWVVPVKPQVPKWLTGNFNSIAVRVSAHPVVAALCLDFGGPITSTSANLAGREPCTTSAQVQEQLGGMLGTIIAASVGQLSQPTTIKDALTGIIYR